MRVLMKKGTFVRQGATGNQSVTGVGFQGKVLICWHTRQTAVGSTSGLQAGFGFAVSSSQRFCCAYASDTAVAVSNTGKGSAAGIIRVFSDGTPTVDAAADFVSFDADGFTIDWTTDVTALAQIIHYVVLGGPGILNAFIGQFAGPAGTGETNFTGVGFKGNFFMQFNTNQTATGDEVNMVFGNGAAVSRFKRGCISGGEADGSDMTTRVERVYSNTTCLISYTNAGTARDNIADFVEFTDDGFDLNYSQTTTNAVLFWALVIQGGLWDIVPNYVGAPVNNTYAGRATPGMVPVGLMAITTGATTASDTEAADFDSVFGAGTIGPGVIEQGGTHLTSDNVINTDTDQSTETIRMIFRYNQDNTLNSSAKVVEDSARSDGFTLFWDDSGGASLHVVIVIGEEYWPGPPTSDGLTA